MQFTPWKTLSSKVLIKYRKWDYVEDEVELPNGKRTTFQYIANEGSSTVIPIDADGNLIVVREYRYLLNDESLEFPAGMIEGELSALETAHKELEEEAGLKAQTMEFIGRCLTATGSVKAFGHYYIARGLSETSRRLEETEQIETFRMTPQAFDRAVNNGEVKASHIVVAWALARHRILG